MMVTLSGLYRYPLKSGSACPLHEAAVGPLGLEGDRRWMLVQPDDGRFLTGREHPRLTRLRADIDPTGALCLTLPGGEARTVPVPPAGGPTQAVTVWSDQVPARVAEDAALTAWLSDWLGAPCRLVYLGEETRRPVDPRYASPGDVVSFADGFPLLLLSEASLADLNGRLALPAPMLAFRPNLVVSGCLPFAEDGWRHLQIGDAVRLEVVKPCARCILTTVDPLTGTRRPDGEPLRTLAGYRRHPGGVMFGQNVAVRQGGLVRCGDRVRVLA